MGAAVAVLLAVLQGLFCAIGVLLAVVLVLLLVVLFVPAFVKIRYDDDELSLMAGLGIVQLHVYPAFYFLWNPHADETQEEQEERLAQKKAKSLAKKAKKDAEKGVKKEAKQTVKIEKKAAAKGAKITLDVIVTLLQTAGMVTKLIVDALRIEQIRLNLPIHASDPAQTAIQYGKVNAWLYPSLAVLNNFLYLDFKELQISPVFEENFERSVFFSCKVSARLFIIVVVAVRLLQVLRKEKALLALLLQAKPKKTAA